MTAAEALCLDCGLCCDGTLFATVRLAPGEAEVLSRHPLPVLRHDPDTPRLCQPCGALGAAGCAIYEARPQGCRRYDCDLLGALAGDELDAAEALALVRTTRAMVDEVRACLPGEDQRRPLRQAVAARIDADETLLARWTVLEERLIHTFVGRRGR